MAKIRAVATRKQVVDLFDEHSNRGLTADVWHMETGFTNMRSIDNASSVFTATGTAVLRVGKRSRTAISYEFAGLELPMATLSRR